MLSTTIRAVAFDMDGLLLNTEDLYGEIGSLLMERRGKPYREEVRKQMIGLPAPLAYGVLIEAESLKETWQELHEETEKIFEEILPHRIATMPGLDEFLERIDRKSLPRCVATSSTREFAERALTLVGLLGRFDFIITANDVSRGKPNPDIYEAAAKKMGVNTSDMLVLEDSPNGTRAGVRAGAYVVSVPNEHTRHGNFEGAKWIANGLKDERFKTLFGDKE